jgi:phage shock protein E
MKMYARLILVCLSMIVSGAALAADAADIKPEALLVRTPKHDKSLVILDVRTAEEFSQGHVRGPMNISHDQLSDRIKELMGDKDKDLVVYCRSGRRTALAIETLKANGFNRLFHLEGDMQKWTEANRPTEK